MIEVNFSGNTFIRSLLEYCFCNTTKFYKNVFKSKSFILGDVSILNVDIPIAYYAFPEYECAKMGDCFKAGCVSMKIKNWKKLSKKKVMSLDKSDPDKAWDFYNRVLLKIIDL